MNIISHNCLSGHLYRLLNKKYTNPFIWTVIDFNSMYKMVTEWDKINFLNYDLINDNMNFSIIIDNKIKIQYVHYKFHPAANKLIKNNATGDIFYNKIWEYIISRYDERITRMLTENENPTFCIANFNTIFPDAFYTQEQINILKQYNNVFILEGFEDKEPDITAVNFLKKYLRHV